jgi:hypothetical protein
VRWAARGTAALVATLMAVAGSGGVVIAGPVASAGPPAAGSGTAASGPDDAVPGDAVPGDAVPGDAVPGDAVPGDGVPASVADPVEAALVPRGEPIRGEVGGAGSGGGLALRRPAWMRRLAPGERPPQFVLFSFDGVGSHKHWRRVLSIADDTGAHVTGFLSGIYLLSDDERKRYQGPGHAPGHASIGFGGSSTDVKVRIADLNQAVAAGHEIGTHYNGHFCTGAEPSVGRWTTAQWNLELDQFFEFIADAPGLRLAPASVVGGRTPCLQGRWDQAVPAMREHGFRYDSSRPSNGIIWPTRTDGFWEFWMPTVMVPALDRRVIMMDYNLWHAFNHVREEPDRAPELTADTLATYWSAYRAAAEGNRAPLVVANHFNDWSGGAFSDATEEFMGQVCRQPETICATYTEVIAWMSLQDPRVLERYRSRPPSGLVTAEPS